MKKIIFLFIIIVSLLAAKPAISQIKFFYYPASNIYYDVADREYIYFDDGRWVTVRRLPAGVRLVSTNRAIVYHTGKNVWVGNAAHIKKYKGQGKKKGWKKRGKG